MLDNLSTHKPKEDRWLKAHPRVRFHFTPTHASWLNQIEVWFSILSRQALAPASFTSITQLRQAIFHPPARRSRKKLWSIPAHSSWRTPLVTSQR